MPSKQLPPPSKEFWDAVIHSGTSVIDCEFCGITHVAVDGDGFEEGELEDLLEKSRKDPDKYFLNNADTSLAWGSIDGKQAVYGCPCNQASRYEQLFWDSRHIIAEYFTYRAKKMQKEAKRGSELSEIVSGIIHQ